VTTTAELDAALAGGAIAGILALEGVEPLGREPQLMRIFRRLGVRLAGLTWNRANDFADGCAEDRGAGITALGRRLLDEMAGTGVALDVSHLTRRATADAIEHHAGPLLASHSNAAAVHPHRRNLDDDLLRGIAGRGGVVGLNFIPDFIGDGDAIDGLARHHAHIHAVAGALAPAVGADFVAFLPALPADPPELGKQPAADTPTPDSRPEPPRETSYAALAERLGDAAEACLAGNALRFLRQALAG
jgi:membrane dipeptidase